MEYRKIDLHENETLMNVSKDIENSSPRQHGLTPDQIRNKSESPDVKIISIE